MRTRPAETTTLVATAVTVLITRVLNTEDQDVFTALLVLIAFIPTGITWLVETFRRRTHFQSGPE